MHPEEQQLEGWGGRNLQSDSAWGKGGAKAGNSATPVAGRTTGREERGVVVTRDNSVTKAHTRHPRGERARVGGGHGRTEERERGADWSRLHGGDSMAHSAGVEDITEVMRRRGVRRHRATPRDSQVRRRTRAHACDAAPPARARLAAWAAAKCARASASASASAFASFASSAARSSPKRVETASSALRLACSRA